MSQLTSGIVILDNNAMIQYLDESAAELLQLSNDNLKKSLHESLNEENILAVFEKCFSSGATVSEELSPSWNYQQTLFIKVEPFKNKKENGFIILINNLSKLRRLEGLQKEFVANVSHELRTPLTSIKMAAESLQLGAIADERMRNKFLSNIQREADRLTRLVNELLVLANLDNKVTLHISTFDPVIMLSDVITSMNFHADLNDITLIADFPEDLPSLEADKDRVQQVLINLTDNAIKCNRQNGKVTLYARHEGDNIVIKVIDTGIGIHKVDISRIFDRFFRVDKARSRVTGGTGLGLSIVKDIIVAHGGNINVESEVDVGTTFIIVLPVKSPVKPENRA